jgi:hypothetical protein
LKSLACQQTSPVKQPWLKQRKYRLKAILRLSGDPPFVPPLPYDKPGFKGEFWYGSNSLWTAVRENGIWEALPHHPGGYTQKVFWWHEAYSIREEPEPALMLIAERLDGRAPSVPSSKATNASAGDIGSTMLIGVVCLLRVAGKSQGDMRRKS